MPDTPRLTIPIDAAADVERDLRTLLRTRVAVGIPADEERGGAGPGSTTREEGTITNAVLGYLFETGSPATNMPARPWLVPGVRESRSRWIPHLRQAGEAAMRGDLEAMNRAFHAAGLLAVSAVKARIQAGIPPRVTRRTAARRFRRRKLPVPANPEEQVTALIDTGQFLNSINYTVRRSR